MTEDGRRRNDWEMGRREMVEDGRWVGRFKAEEHRYFDEKIERP